tara:strand:+ start:783 stop:950 length:168 start_codon:yes stop_codon:yes gene_type:complete
MRLKVDETARRGLAFANGHARDVLSEHRPEPVRQAFMAFLARPNVISKENAHASL